MKIYLDRVITQFEVGNLTVDQLIQIRDDFEESLEGLESVYQELCEKFIKYTIAKPHNLKKISKKSSKIFNVASETDSIRYMFYHLNKYLIKGKLG